MIIRLEGPGELIGVTTIEKLQHTYKMAVFEPAEVLPIEEGAFPLIAKYKSMLYRLRSNPRPDFAVYEFYKIDGVDDHMICNARIASLQARVNDLTIQMEAGI